MRDLSPMPVRLSRPWPVLVAAARPSQTDAVLLSLCPSQRYHRDIMAKRAVRAEAGTMMLFRSIENLLATNIGRARFVLRASLLAIVPSLLVFGVLVALGLDTLRIRPSQLDPAFLAYSVLLAPAIETALMLALAAVLARLVPKQAALQIVLVALVAALAHGIGGNWRQVFGVTWPMLVYATSLVLWLRRSASDAFVVTTTVHALYNVAFVAVGILGALAMAKD